MALKKVDPLELQIAWFNLRKSLLRLRVCNFRSETGPDRSSSVQEIEKIDPRSDPELDGGPMN